MVEPTTVQTENTTMVPLPMALWVSGVRIPSTPPLGLGNRLTRLVGELRMDLMLTDPKLGPPTSLKTGEHCLPCSHAERCMHYIAKMIAAVGPAVPC